MNKKPLYELTEKQKANIQYYIIFKCPNTPTGKGEYIGKTPIFEQALAAIEGYNEKGEANGEVYALSAVLKDGTETIIL